MQFAVTSQVRASDTSSARGDRSLFLAIAVLAALGICVSAVSLQRHYAKSATGFCDLGERFDCDIVNRSEYSRVMGIPVAGIGVVGYGVLLALATVYRSRAETPFRLLVTALAGLGFALYLTYVRGICAGALVHSVLEFAWADCGDYGAGGCGEGQGFHHRLK